MPSLDFCCIGLLGLGNTGSPIYLCLDGGYVASVSCNTVVCLCNSAAGTNCYIRVSIIFRINFIVYSVMKLSKILNQLIH